MIKIKTIIKTNDVDICWKDISRDIAVLSFSVPTNQFEIEIGENKVKELYNTIMEMLLINSKPQGSGKSQDNNVLIIKPKSLDAERKKIGIR